MSHVTYLKKDIWDRIRTKDRIYFVVGGEYGPPKINCRVVKHRRKLDRHYGQIYTSHWPGGNFAKAFTSRREAEKYLERKKKTYINNSIQQYKDRIKNLEEQIRHANSLLPHKRRELKRLLKKKKEMDNK